VSSRCSNFVNSGLKSKLEVQNAHENLRKTHEMMITVSKLSGFPYKSRKSSARFGVLLEGLEVAKTLLNAKIAEELGGREEQQRPKAFFVFGLRVLAVPLCALR